MEGQPREVPSPHGVPVVGWVDEGTINLYPTIARQQVDLLDKGILNGVSANAIHSQLETLGLIAKSDKGRKTANKRGPDGRQGQVLVLTADALAIGERPEHEAIAQELGL